MAEDSSLQPSTAHNPPLDLGFAGLSLHDLLAQRNAAQPAVRAPSEILAHIFQSLKDILDNQNAPFYIRKKVPYPWINTMQVCRRWREVALDTLSLWTVLRIRHPGQAGHPLNQLVLDHSVMTSLVIDVRTFKDDDSNALLNIALPHLVRARVIAFMISPSAFESLELHVPTFLPLLTDLELISPQYSNLYHPHVRLPASVLRWFASGLTKLTIVDYAIRWSTTCFPATLMELSIIKMRLGGPLTSLHQVIQALSGLRSLQRLELHAVITQAMNEESAKHATLHKLESLKLFEVAPAAVVQFLDVLVPSSTRIHVSFTDDSPLTFPLIPRVIPPLAARLPGPKPPDTLVLFKDRIILSDWTSTICSIDLGCIAGTKEGRWTTTRDIFAPLLDTCGFGITTLILDHCQFEEGPNLVAWEVLFRQIPNVQTLTFRRYERPKQDGVAQIVERVSGSDLWLPKLKTLSFEHSNFAQIGVLALKDANFFAQICTAAAGLDEVRFKQCKVHEPDVAFLRTAVRRVVWDVYKQHL
ncbi:hypothetical protein EIP91_006441 [Steccherinum ochraceum]|uniref:F-box domain-containing protein n=1 Tax=Steccherinum ochraceum TaxID=92696 RepID=A0A4R0R8D7_9APHY|nr:hypothetical protein EIP91_006441 [Steccherinum ochraceum]